MLSYMVPAQQIAAKLSFTGSHEMQQKLVCSSGLWYKARRQIRSASSGYLGGNARLAK
ncbi:hypothetical protein ND444_03465 [Yersinia ruckeri]|uniref:hypothetical protein n=1 Tax=Yersinia ruckeri TaxID=29486 RepID=UPI0022382DA3|nr:hypothetical protein [Yersinia ruckeri]MCW6608062.1 hypothetical protein [Yersinia ruckeri]UZX95475.1 hypothetical protein ND444_03465 [Yersinia ruckeri]